VNTTPASFQFCEPGEYKGFIATKGICLCQADDLETICDAKCRKKSANKLTFVCADAPDEPYLQVSDGNGVIKVSAIS